MSIFRYILRRALLAIPLLLGITLIAFAISQFVPSDPVVANLGQSAMSDPTIVAAFRKEWGLDRPIHEQYLTYLGNLLQGDLGRSIKSRRPVVDDLRAYLPATIELATAATLIGTLTGVIFGVISAVRRNALIDFAVRAVSLVGVSLPVFWLALVGLQIFYARLGWFPGPGRLDIGMDTPPRLTGMVTIDAIAAGQWDVLWSGLSHLMLPALVLSTFTTGLVTRVTRSAMLEVLGLEYIRTAYAKGLQERLVVLRHALRNALIPVVTVVGFSYGNLLAGTVLTETIFAWPGIGWYAYRASTSLDFPAIMGVSMVIALIFVITNLVVDLLYFVLDPRLRAA
jgi:peptide/nickel transport system permease protein